MKSKTLISLAVASAFACSAAYAGGAKHGAGVSAGSEDYAVVNFDSEQMHASATLDENVGSTSSGAEGSISSPELSLLSDDGSGSLSIAESMNLLDQGIYSGYMLVGYTPIESWDYYLVEVDPTTGYLVMLDSFDEGIGGTFSSAGGSISGSGDSDEFSVSYDESAFLNADSLAWADEGFSEYTVISYTPLDSWDFYVFDIDSTADQLAALDEDSTADQLAALDEDSTADQLAALDEDSTADQLAALDEDSTADQLAALDEDSSADQLAALDEDSSADRVAALDDESMTDHMAALDDFMIAPSDLLALQSADAESDESLG